MSDNTTGQWAAVAALFDKLHELDADERERALRRADVDEVTRDRVRRMLEALEDEPDFLERPATSQPEPEPAAIYSSLDPDELVGDFRIEKLIGRGGMGEVYLAERHGTDFEQHVALKLIRWHERACEVLDPDGLVELAQWEGLGERRRPLI